MLPKVTLIAIGTELVALGRADTNGEWLAARIVRAGYEIEQTLRVADDMILLASVFQSALERGNVVISTGGLGPTEDDRTRAALAAAAGVSLVRDDVRLALLRGLFAARSIPFGPGQARQADRPAGAEWIDNPFGSAPGLDLRRGGGRLFALPGVPAEMKAMFDAHVAPALGTGRGVLHRVLRIASRGEGTVDDELKDVYATPGLSVTILSHPGQLELHLRVVAGPEAQRTIATVEREVRARLGDAVYGADADTLASVAGALLAARGETVGTAESCTAGLLAAALTEPPGSSVWFRGGLIVYADVLKRSLAGVAAETLARHGAVSEAVAGELAAGARERLGADWGIGVTGIAGPAGGGADKPVGTVHIAIRGPRGERNRRYLFHGDRGQVRAHTVNAALDGLRRLAGSPA